MDNDYKLASAAAELREQVEQGDIDPDDLSALAAAGMVPQNVAERLYAYKRAYDQQPTDEKDTDPDGDVIYWAEDTSRWETIARRYVIRAISDAVRNDRLSTLNFALGKLKGGHNEDWVKMKQIEKWLSKDGRLCVFGGQMGNGKTSAALRLIEFYKLMHESTKVASNIPSWREKNAMVSGVEDLETWIDETGGKKAVVLDEMSSAATGYDNLALQMAELIRKMRHARVDLMIVIGHRVEADIHPSIREIADICLKPDLTTMEIYDAIGDNEPNMTLSMADTGYTYDDTEDNTPWEWRDDDEVDYAEMAKKAAVNVYQSTDLTQIDVAEMMTEAGFEMSASTISKAQRAY